MTPALQLSAGYHYFFDKSADYNGLEEEINKNTTEYLLGAEYALTDKWTVSAGTQFTNYDVTDNYNNIGVQEKYERKSIAGAIGATFSF